MSRFQPKAVLFDLDGTLVDSAPDLVAAINRLRREQGLGALPLGALRPVVSKGGRAMLAVAFPDRDEAGREALLQPFLDRYAQALAVESRPFEGVETLLAALEREGIAWGIVTNKPVALAREVVAGMGWARHCAVLLGGDSLPRKKPEPDQLVAACAQLAVPCADCIYVGDDERDIVAARTAGMPSVAALWGYRDEGEDPRAWGADDCAGSATDLHALLGLRARASA